MTAKNSGIGRNMSIRDESLFELVELQDSDPSVDYIITHDHKIGTGGFGKVFKVTRRRDGQVCALKFCHPRSMKERNMLINEIGLMNQCRESETVI